MNTNEKTLEAAMTSPALKSQRKSNDRSEYPAKYCGRVPLKVIVAKTVTPDMPFLAKPNTICQKDEEYHVWVNSQGAVSAILPNGEKLGLLPSEFDVTEWHTSEEDFWVECNVCKTQLKNHVGSTPCCGSIAYIVENGKKTNKVALYVQVDK